MKQLNDKENAILDLLIEGLSNEEIGTRLEMKLDTVKGHLKSIFPRLGVRNRVQAAVAGALAKVADAKPATVTKKRRAAKKKAVKR